MVNAYKKMAFVSGGVLTEEICTALTELGYYVSFLRDENPELSDSSTGQAGERTLEFKIRDFSASELSNAVIETVEKFGEVDLLVFVGGSGQGENASMLLDIDAEQWDNCMNRSARGFFLLIKYLLPYLISRTGSQVIVADITGDLDDSASAAASAALAAAVKQMTEELSACGISISYKRTSADNTASYITDILTAK